MQMIFTGRNWKTDGAELMYSAFGKFDDFESQDAGRIYSFDGQSEPITKLERSSEGKHLLIFKGDDIFALSGTSPVDYTIARFPKEEQEQVRGCLSEQNTKR